jgi:hypothetical protein
MNSYDCRNNCGVDAESHCQEIKELPENTSLLEQTEMEEPSVTTNFNLDEKHDTVKHCLGPDQQQAARFLSQLAADEIFTFQTFPDRRDDWGSKDLVRVFHGTLEDHVEELARLNSKGAGIFFMVNRGDGRGRCTKNVTGVRALFVDLDGAPLEPVLAAPLVPDIVVETSPGRYHVYWKVDGIKLSEFSHFQIELASRFGGDPNIKDLPRVMRLPGFFHLKQEPFLVRIVEVKREVIHV